MTAVNSFVPLVCVVAFHHARYSLNIEPKKLITCLAQLKALRGPEIENWFGVEDGNDPAIENDWSFLPFMALSDGAHA